MHDIQLDPNIFLINFKRSNQEFDIGMSNKFNHFIDKNKISIFEENLNQLCNHMISDKMKINDKISITHFHSTHTGKNKHISYKILLVSMKKLESDKITVHTYGIDFMSE
jgi:hypothetical protein